jgi:hypothetical protein
MLPNIVHYSLTISDAILLIEADHFEGQHCNILGVNVGKQFDFLNLEMQGRAVFIVRYVFNAHN